MPEIPLELTLGDPWRSFISAFLGFSSASFLFNTFTRGVGVRYLLRQPETFRKRVGMVLNTLVFLAATIGGGAYFAGLATASRLVLLVAGMIFVLAFFAGVLLEPRLNHDHAPQREPTAKPRNFWNRDHVIGVTSVLGSILSGAAAGWISSSSTIAFAIGATAWVALIRVVGPLGDQRMATTDEAG